MSIYLTDCGLFIARWISGLSYIGTPCEDEGETLGLHGRLAATPAEEVGYRTERTDDGIEFVINGKVRETRLFGENLTLERTIRCRYGENVLRIEDKVTNHGSPASRCKFFITLITAGLYYRHRQKSCCRLKA